MKERYLFRADWEGAAERGILELRPNASRLLVPSYPALRTVRGVPILMFLGYLALLGVVLSIFVGRGDAISLLAAAAATLAAFAGFVLLYVWWDRVNLPILAEEPSRAQPIVVLGLESRQKVSELRAKAGDTETRVTVHGTREQLEEALRFAGLAVGAG